MTAAGWKISRDKTLAAAAAALLLLVPAAVQASGAPAATAQYAPEAAPEAAPPQQPAAQPPAAQQQSANPGDAAIVDPYLNMDLTEALRENIILRKTEVEPSQIKTLFFTLWQHSLLQEAKMRFRTRPPEEGETNQDSTKPRPRGIRELSLGGIAYATPTDWTVWLNGMRITPKALPKEILDIKVYEKYIELKWVDGYTNLVYPIRLHTHERFNLDSRIFLPGAGISQPE
jgi:hypothetical protein